jgi:hypothetical protein
MAVDPLILAGTLLTTPAIDAMLELRFSHLLTRLLDHVFFPNGTIYSELEEGRSNRELVEDAKRGMEHLLELIFLDQYSLLL